MTTPPESKSTVEQIRERFDHDVERFSNLETRQSAAIDFTDPQATLPRFGNPSRTFFSRIDK